MKNLTQAQYDTYMNQLPQELQYFRDFLSHIESEYGSNIVDLFRRNMLIQEKYNPDNPQGVDKNNVIALVQTSGRVNIQILYLMQLARLEKISPVLFRSLIRGKMQGKMDTIYLLLQSIIETQLKFGQILDEGWAENNLGQKF